MGADIHMSIEYKDENDQWKYAERLLNNPVLEGHRDNYFCWYDRNYSAFSLLAGVRGSFEPIRYAEDRFPDDATEDSKADFAEWEGDAHSLRVYTLKELYDYHAQIKKNVCRDIPCPKCGTVVAVRQQNADPDEQEIDEIMDGLKERWLHKLEDLHTDHSKIRIIMWFDN